MLADIIVRSKNGADFTQDCIRSIRENTPWGEYRIILVDDGSTPPLHKVLDDTGDIYVRGSESRGAVTATNRGLALALTMSDTPYVAVFDNDTRVPSGDVDWLNRFIAELEEFPGTAAVGATTNWANPPQHILTAPNTYTAEWRDNGKGGMKDNPEIPVLVSFACLLKKDAIRSVGLWDERYNPGNFEDTDYAVSLRANGFAVRVARSVYIHHVGHSTFGLQLQRLLRVNEQKFLEKWGVGTLFDMRVVPPEYMKAVVDRAMQK